MTQPERLPTSLIVSLLLRLRLLLLLLGGVVLGPSSWAIPIVISQQLRVHAAGVVL